MITVKINGTDFEVEGGWLTYERIVELADTQWGKEALHSVVYSHRLPFDQLPGERNGILSPGKRVVPTQGMVIDAVVTGAA
jgi:hypothetical protein